MVLSTDASAADSSLSRRGAVTTLAAGFALAVQPIGAQTITTDTDGLVADVV
ncbi:MAG: carboxymethylenebutenolidase, partial [Planctomycetes bacterium]|nr:carboxymethylenebutenolidase [Planctomycetota bacterium]